MLRLCTTTRLPCAKCAHGRPVLVAANEVEKPEIVYRDGFAVVRDALAPEQLASMQAACDRTIHEMLSLDKHRVGNRGSHRYSLARPVKPAI